MARMPVQSFACQCWDCPHCGFRNFTSEVFLERFDGEVDCSRCKQEFVLEEFEDA